MPLSEERLSLLKEFGLNRLQARTYLGLLLRGPMDAKQLSKISKIPYCKIYSPIEELLTLGYVNVIPAVPRKYQAIPPTKAFSSVPQEWDDKFKRVCKFEELMQSPVIHQSIPDFMVVQGRRNIYEKLGIMITSSKKRINIYTIESGLKQLLYFREALQDAGKRKVQIRICAPITSGNKEEADYFSFCEVKDSMNLPTIIWCLDGTHSIFINNSENKPEQLVALVSSQAPFTASISHLYDSHWER